MDRTLLPSQPLVWRAFAEEIGAHYEPGDLWTPERIVVRRGECTVSILQETVGPGIACFHVTVWRARLTARSDGKLLVARADVAPEQTPDGPRYRVTGDARHLLNLPWMHEAMSEENLLSVHVGHQDIVVIVAGTLWEAHRLLFFTELTLGLIDARTPSPGGEGQPMRRALEAR